MTDLLERYRAAPWRLHALSLGLVSALSWLVLFPPLAQAHSGLLVLASTVGFGAVMGPALAGVAVDVRRREDQLMGLDAADRRHQVRVAAARGRRPSDPDVCRAALVVAELRADNVHRLRTIGVVSGAIWLALAGWLAVHGRPVAVVLVAMAALFLALCLIRPVQLQRRLHRLAAEQP